MKSIVLSLLFSCIFCSNGFGQNFHTGDRDFLLKIDNDFDDENSLNWNTEPDPSKWGDVIWNNEDPRRVTTFNANNIGIDGSLDLTSLTRLEYVSVTNNTITSIDASNLSSLTTLRAFTNQITSINLTGTNNLEELYIQSNNITQIDLTGKTNLQALSCSDNNLSSASLSGCHDLTTVYFHGNPNFSSLNLSDLPALTMLNCSETKLTSLDLRSFTALEEINFARCDLTELRISGLSRLIRINLMYNDLKHLDLSGVHAANLYVSFNQLEDMDFSDASANGTTYCRDNKLPFSSLATLLHINNTTYINQGDLYSPQTVAGNVELNYTSEALINGTATTFNFYKNGNLVTTNTTGLYTTTGNGVYHCTMTNSLFPGLTLTTSDVTVASGTKSLTSTPSTLSYEAAADNSSAISITSNTAWVVSSDADWVKPVLANGTGNEDVYVQVEANTTFSSRTATLTITGQGVPERTVSISQEGLVPNLEVSKTQIDSDFYGLSTNFKITSNADWSISSNQSWITFIPSSGSGIQNISVSIQQNLGDTDRTGTISITSQAPTQTISVTQNHAYLETPVDAVTIGYEENSSANITLDFNINNWNATCDQSWVTFTNSSGNQTQKILSFYANSANSTTQERTANITVTGSNGVDPITITLTQSSEFDPPELTVNQDAFEREAASNTFELQISSNTTWDISSSESWATLSVSSGSNSQSVTISLEENAETTSRTTTITITPNGLDPVEVTVRQLAENPVTAIGDEGMFEVKLFPNPVEGKLNFEFPFSKAIISILDLSGKEVIKNFSVTNTGNIDLSGLMPGVYILRAASDEQLFERKIVKR